MPTFKYYIDEVEYSPINTGAYTHDFNLEEDSGFYQFVYSLNGMVMFSEAAYTFILLHGDCEEILFKITEKSQNGEFTLLDGFFTNRDCEFDHDKRTVKVSPTAQTAYQCVKDNWNVNFNFLSFGNVVSSTYSNSPQFEFDALQGSPSGDIPKLPFFGSYLQVQPGISPFFLFSSYGRELRTTYCVGGELQPPTGTGWELLVDNCTALNTATWFRIPLIFIGPPLLFASAFATNTVAFTPVPNPATPNDENWIKIKEFFIGSGTYIGLFVDYNAIKGEELELNNGRLLLDVINFGLNEVGCNDLDVQSDFFTNEINPITLETPNPMKDIQMHAISDIKDPEATEVADLENINLREIFEGYILGRCNCRLIADERTKRLRIEHISTILGNTTYNIGYFQLSDVETFDNSDIPRAEEFPSLDSSIDFTGVDIKYDNKCAKDKTVFITDKFYSEVESIINDPDEYPSDGVVMITPNSLAPTEAGTIGENAQDGAITGDFRPNMPQGQANLHERYWRYYRPFPVGNINFNDVTMGNNRPVKKMPPVSVPLCNLGGSLFLLDLYAFFSGSSNGVQFNEGLLKSLSYNESTDRATLNIQYYE